jgi:hypothetical protein
LQKIKNPVHRQALTQIRLSAHKLNVEVGRNLGIPREDRLSTSCNIGAIEDEYHFILQCEKHNLLRESLLVHIPNVFPYFTQIFENRDN